MELGGIILSVVSAVLIMSKGQVLQLVQNANAGEVMILCSSIAWTTYVLIGSVMLRAFTADVIVTWSVLLGTVCFLPFAFYQGMIEVVPHFPWEVWAWFVFLGLFNTALSLSWYYQCMAILGVSRTGIFIGIGPAFGIPLSHIISHETLF